MGLGQEIGNYLDKTGITIKELSQKTEIPYHTLYAAIQRDSSSMKIEYVKKIFNVLGIENISTSTDQGDLLFYLTQSGISCDTEYTLELTTEENKLIGKYRALNKVGQTEAMKRVDELTYIPKYCNDTPEHLKIVATHNDHTDDEEEQQLMQEDLKDL